MTRLPLATGALFAACALPAGLVLGLAMLVPNDGRRWVVCFVALALALIGTSYGPGWVEGWQRRRRARARVRAALHREAGERQGAG
ncbi:hypothetical protein ACWC5I_19065 [Kitasatospora sp. NPDC001574]